MAGVDLAYDSDGLRSGGREALGAGEVASGANGDRNFWDVNAEDFDILLLHPEAIHVRHSVPSL